MSGSTTVTARPWLQNMPLSPVISPSPLHACPPLPRTKKFVACTMLNFTELAATQ